VPIVLSAQRACLAVVSARLLPNSSTLCRGREFRRSGGDCLSVAFVTQHSTPVAQLTDMLTAIWANFGGFQRSTTDGV
jgi:hypothetical protein